MRFQTSMVSFLKHGSTPKTCTKYPNTMPKSWPSAKLNSPLAKLRSKRLRRCRQFFSLRSQKLVLRVEVFSYQTTLNKWSPRLMQAPWSTSNNMKNFWSKKNRMTPLRSTLTKTHLPRQESIQFSMTWHRAKKRRNSKISTKVSLAMWYRST